MNELINVMSVLVNNLKDHNTNIDDGKSARRDVEALEHLLNNLSEYPLLDCYPASILDNMQDNKPCFPFNKGETTVSCQPAYIVTVEPTIYNPSEIPNINSAGKGDHQNEILCNDIEVSIGDIEIDLCDDLTNNDKDTNDNKMIVTDLLPHLDNYSTHSERKSTYEPEDEAHDINDNVALHNLVPETIIGKKLGQNRMSNITASSSSEGEDENDKKDENKGKCNSITNAVFEKFLNLGVSKTTQEKTWNIEEKDYIRPVKGQGKHLVTPFSGKIDCKGEFTTNPDLLHRFGQQSIHLEQDNALAKALIQVFHESNKGPDVQPPRNDRRTLKLSKSDDQGYGFWLQTYDFGKAGLGKKRTFVRYVEDEGPAYLSGLREGDVIVEVNGQNVEQIEHMKIVGLISETAKQLMLVVKFMDMVRRVELAVRLKKSQAKLKIKMEELEKIKDEEKKLYNTIGCESSKDEMSRLSNYSSAYSSSLEGDLDRLSLDTSSESGLGSLSSISDEVVVRTSKFEKRSSRVLDSIKELNCSCTLQCITNSDFNTPLSTTENDLLNVYSDNIGVSRIRSGLCIKRNESVPAHKRSSYPLLDLPSELEPRNIREASTEKVAGDQHTKFHERFEVQDFGNSTLR